MLQYTVIIAIAGGRENREKLYDRYSQYIPKQLRSKKAYIYNPYRIQLPISDDNPILPDVIDDFRSCGADPRIVHDVHYTKKELERAAFFRFFCASYPFELEGTSSKSYGTKHIGGCPYCGLGSSAVGDVLVDKRFIKTTNIGNINPEYIASKSLKQIVETDGLTGVMFQQNIRDWKGRDMPPFYTMHMAPLPPLDSSTWLVPGKTSHKGCGHRATFIASELRYNEDALAGAKDFNITQEYLNAWNIPEIIVSAKVRDVFRSRGVRASFLPIMIVPKGETMPPPPPYAGMGF